MITPSDTLFPIGTPADLAAKLWCVYEHHAFTSADEPPEIIYVNACPLADVFKMNDAYNNSDWLKVTGHGNDRPIMIRVIATTPEKLEALAFMNKHVRSFATMPRCNMFGYTMAGSTRPILCSDGREFANQTEAADALGVSQALVSLAVNGKRRSVRGFTLTRKVGL